MIRKADEPAEATETVVEAASEEAAPSTDDAEATDEGAETPAAEA